MFQPPLTLFHVSDLHFGYEDRDALGWFRTAVERERPAAVLCTGDLTMRGTAREFAMAEDWLASLPAPLMLVAGNHDVPYYNHMLQRMTRPYKRYNALEQALGSGLTQADIALADLAVVPLKTIARAQWRLNWSKGRVSNADLDSALAGLERQRAKPLRLVIGHHPLIDTDTEGSGSTRGGKRALVALARAGAQVVLSGHVHDPFDLTFDAQGLPIRLIGAGTLSQRLRATQPSFNVLRVTGDTIAIEVRKFGNPPISAEQVSEASGSAFPAR